MKKNILIAGIAVICIVGITLGIVIPLSLLPPTAPPEEKVHIFDSPTYSWDTTTPEDQGMNWIVLSGLYDYIFANQFDIDSILVSRNGFIVTESYFDDSSWIKEDMEYSASNPRLYSNTQKHGMWSATKSVTAILIGIALKKGFIDNLSQTLFEILPERWNSTYDARKLDITIENLLRMEGGFFGEFYGTFEAWGYDYLQYRLSTPLLYDPGTPYSNQWGQYSGAGVTSLSGIINKTTGMKMADFAQEYLFDPLGIPAENYYWTEYDGLNTGASGLYMYPHDMAKLGYLVINNGTWDGTEIVTSEYINAMLTDYPGDMPYGYLTWSNPGDPTIWYMSGMYGQNIMMIRELNVVVVFTATEDTYPPTTIVRDYILSSIL